MVQVSRDFVVSSCRIVGVAPFVFFPQILPAKRLKYGGSGRTMPDRLRPRDGEIITHGIAAKKLNQVAEMKQEAFEVPPRLWSILLPKTLSRESDHVDFVENGLCIAELERAGPFIGVGIWRNLAILVHVEPPQVGVCFCAGDFCNGQL